MKKYTPKPELGYVLCEETLEDGTVRKTQIPYRSGGPGVVRKGANFAKAATKHVASGRKEATDKQVDERYAICAGCPSELFTPKMTLELETGEDILVGKCNSMSCGCDLAPSHYPHKNKLRWASQSCPHHHWGQLDR